MSCNPDNFNLFLLHAILEDLKSVRMACKDSHTLYLRRS